MNDTTRTILIAAGVTLVVVVLVPFLVMVGMMGSMVGSTGRMMGGWFPWLVASLVLLVLLLGVMLIVIGLNRHQ